MSLDAFDNPDDLGTPTTWGAWDKVAGKPGGTASGKRKRMIGVELDRVPLCVNCDVEMEGKDQKDVIEKGLETVSRFDGGLTRDRLEMLSEEKEETRKVSRSRWKRRQFRASPELEKDLKRYINNSSGRVGSSSR